MNWIKRAMYFPSNLLVDGQGGIAYDALGASDTSLAHNIGAGARKLLLPFRKKPKVNVRPLNFGVDVLPHTLGWGGGAAGAARLLGNKNPATLGILGLLGATYGTYNRMSGPLPYAKSSAYKSDLGGDSALKKEIIQKLQRAPGVSFTEANDLAVGVSRLNSMQLRDLYNMLSTASGGIIGSLIMRFLMKAGVLGTIGGGVAGAMLGNALTKQRTPVDYFGRPVLQTGY